MMKKSVTSFLFLVLISLLFSCSDAEPEFNSDLKKSEDVWKAFRESSGNTYRYTVSFQSWTGTGTETVISVAEGKVVRRAFRYTGIQNLPENFPEAELEWVENENELGKHEHSAAQPMTLDEVYSKAKNEWLVKRSDAKTYFTAENAGMISSAGYVEDGCMDDCFRGIRVTAITAGK